MCSTLGRIRFEKIIFRAASNDGPFSMKAYVIIFLVGLMACREATPVKPFVFPEEEKVSLLFCGDIMQHFPQILSAYDSVRKEHNYMNSFKYMANYWLQTDFTIANLETTLSDKGFSGYPRFCSPWQLVRDMHRCGITTFVTANNHCCDQGEQGIKKAIHYLDSLHIEHTGTFSDTASYQDRFPLYLEKGKFKIALLNYTYGTNGLPVPKGCVVSLIDTSRIKRHIQKARQDSASNIIVFMHWGYEYHSTPNATQKKLNEWLHRQGVDIVIGSHPHVVQPAEYAINGKDTVGITVYSLGNLISNQHYRYTDGGISVRLTLTRKADGLFSYRMKYLGHYLYRPYENGARKYYIVPEPMADSIVKGNYSISSKKYFLHLDSLLKQIEKIKEQNR